MTHRTTRFVLAAGCLAAQLSAPTAAWAHGGLAEALIIIGFTVHLFATLACAFTGALIFGKNRKLKVFGLSFASAFFAEILIMLVPMGLRFVSDSGFIVTYMITVVVVTLFFSALNSGAFKKRPATSERPSTEG